MVTLEPITDDNREAVEALTVAPGQERFVSDVRESMRQAAAEPGAKAILWAIYDDDEPVGFAMIADEVEGVEYISHFLWKFMIDQRFQRRGYGTASLDLIVAYFRDRGVPTMYTSAGQGEGSPIPFYERYGFVRTGEEVGDEVMLQLEISSPGAARG